MTASSNAQISLQDNKECEKSGNHDTTLEHNKFLVTNTKEIEIYELPDEEFRIIVFKKFSKLQENR
jgi:hypothetical protein